MSWSPAGEAHANNHEVLFYTLLHLHDAITSKTVGELTNWATVARRERSAAEMLKEKWTPIDATMFDRMEKITKRVWHEPELSAIAKAMRAATWHEGHHDELDYKRLRYHLDKSPEKIFGVRVSKKKRDSASATWNHWPEGAWPPSRVMSIVKEIGTWVIMATTT